MIQTQTQFEWPGDNGKSLGAVTRTPWDSSPGTEAVQAKIRIEWSFVRRIIAMASCTARRDGLKGNLGAF